MGFLWAATVDGEKVIAFEVAPGQVVFGLSETSLASARKVAAGLNIVVEAVMKDDEGNTETLTIIGPRGRVKKIFAFLGHKL